MKPVSTLYRLASTAADYRACHAIMRANQNFHDLQLHWPTVVAERNGKILGFMSTNKCDWCLLAGPLETSTHNPIMVMRLAEAYEAALRVAGITRYCFAIKRSQKRWLEQVSSLDMTTEVAGDKNEAIFEKILPGDPLVTRIAA